MGRIAGILLIALACVIGCKESDDFGPQSTQPIGSDSAALKNILLVGCEGNFQLSNASLARYNKITHQLEKSVFFRNNGFGLGDVLQSMTKKGDSIFLVMNNSGIIRVVVDSTLQQINVIQGLNSPRYLILNGSDEIIVTDFGAGEIIKVNLASGQIIQRQSAPIWTENIVANGDAIWVAGKSDSTLRRYNRHTLQPIQNVKLPCEPSYLLRVSTDLMILGNSRGDHGVILKIIEHAVVAEIETMDPVIGAYAFQDQLFVLHKKRVAIYNADLERIGGFDHKAENPYAIFVDDDGYFITDVKDYVSEGVLFHYSPQQALIAEVSVGPIPQAMVGL